MIKINTDFKLLDLDEEKVDYTLNEKGEHSFNYFAGKSDEEDIYWKTKLAEDFSGWDKEVHASIISQLIMSLTWDYNAYVDSIFADMWFGVSVGATVWDDKHENYEIVNIFMQCEDVQIGVFACSEMLKKITPQKEEKVVDTKTE